MINCTQFSLLADCERGFSALGRIKTKSRNSLSTVMLDSLMMLTTEGPPANEFDYEKAADLWAKSPTRLNLV